MTTPPAHDARIPPVPPLTPSCYRRCSSWAARSRRCSTSKTCSPGFSSRPLTRFSAFSVYLLDEKRQELRIAYAVGYPEGAPSTMRLKPGQGGRRRGRGRPADPGERHPPGASIQGPAAQHAVAAGADAPQGPRDGALNLLSEAEAAFTSQDEALLRQFAAHVAVAIENARLFRSERQHVDTLETLAEIGREMSSILDLDALLTRIASLTKRLIDYRTFGILLVNQETDELEMKLAVRYGKGAETKHVKLGVGLVGWSALHKEPVLVSDVSQDPRYISWVEDARSELVIPMLSKIGASVSSISRAPNWMRSPRNTRSC